MALKVAIFYSSSTADKKLKENLEHHLNRLRTRGFIDVYDASHIEPGAPQEQSVATKLQMAEIILLLISANPLGGSRDPLYKKGLEQALKQHEEKKSLLIPILLRPYNLKGTPYGELGSLPENGVPVANWTRRQDAFVSIVNSLEDVITNRIKNNDQVNDDTLNDNQLNDNQSKEYSPVSTQSSLSRTNVSLSYRTPNSVLSEWTEILPRIIYLFIVGFAGLFILLAALNMAHFTRFIFITLIIYFLLIVLVTFFWQVPRVARAERLSRVSEYCKSIFLSIRYHRLYREQVILEHQFSDVKSLPGHASESLELESVYVDLSLNPTAVHMATTNPFSVPAKGLPFLQYLSLFEPPNQSSKMRLVIMGAPGSGKTTLLKYLALLLAQQEEDLHYFKSYLPVFLSLYDLVSDVNKNGSGFTLAHAAHDLLQKKSDVVLPVAWFQRLLKRGRCFILLDGLNDISELAARKQIVEWVQKQMRLFYKCHFILTSRAYAYRDCRMDGVSEREVQSFSKSQIKEFVQEWYFANAQKRGHSDILEAQKIARESASDLFRHIDHMPALSDLAVNPLLLTIIANIDGDGSKKELPDRRIALYEEICAVFLRDRQEDSGRLRNFSIDVKKQILQHLAYKMMNDGKRELALKEVEEIISHCLSPARPDFAPHIFIELMQRCGLLLDLNHGFYNFAHLAFQEFFAAKYMENNSLEDELILHITDTWWRETICLYCALTKDATTFIEACISEDNLSVKSLELVLECQKEANIQLPTRNKIDALLLQNVESANVEMRLVAAEGRLTQRLSLMADLQKSLYIDTSLISCAEYQLFLDEQSESSQFYQPDHWLEISFSKGDGNNPVLGVRFADAVAFCQWLTKRENGPWFYRLPTASEAQAVLGRDDSSDLKEGKIGFWTQEKQERRVLWFQEPLSPEEITKEVSGGYKEAFYRVFHRTLDFDSLSSAINKIDADLKASQKHMSSKAFRKHFPDHIKKYDSACSVLDDLKKAFDKCWDRTLSSSGSPDKLSIKEELYDVKSTNFLNVRRNLQPLIEYFEGVSIAQSSQDKKRRGRKKINTAFDVFDTLNKYLEIDVTFLVLEKRLSGVWPTWEGILLVKERKDDSGTNKLTATT